jgi:hypothetical protein
VVIERPLGGTCDDFRGTLSERLTIGGDGVGSLRSLQG